jgi:hypothetical protein
MYPHKIGVVEIPAFALYYIKSPKADSIAAVFSEIRINIIDCAGFSRLPAT